jgi:hypothetical protein
MRATTALRQLQSEMEQTEQALADIDHQPFDLENENKVDGYWYGRYHGLRESIFLMQRVVDHKE